MADKKISQLTDAGTAFLTDELAINRAGVSNKLTVESVLASEKADRISADGVLSTLETTTKVNLVAAINEVNTNVALKMPLTYLDIDAALTANSDTKVPSQKAIKAYIASVATPSATETVQGKAEIATQAETTTGTDDTRFITPLKLKTNLTSKNYLSGTLLAKTLPIYDTVSGTLVDSVIKQSSSGNRVLVNGVTDDTATALQVSGSIRQTAVTNKITAFDTNGILVSGGSGTSGTLPIWNAINGLGNSSFFEQSNATAIGTTIDATAKFYVPSTNTTTSIKSINTNTTASNTWGVHATSSGIKAGANIGIYGNALGSTIANIAVEGNAQGTSPINIGGKFNATGGTANYAIQLTDGTQTVVGRFLKNITTDGYANWASITTDDITSGLGGSLHSIPRWTGTKTLASSVMFDNGTGGIGIGNLPNTSKLYVASSGGNGYGIQSSNTTNTSDTHAIHGACSATKTFKNIGIGGYASNSSVLNVGVIGSALTATAGKNVGGSFIVTLGAANHAVQLKDGSEGAGKVLQCMDTDGYANWVSHYIVNTILANPNFNGELININFDLGNYVIIDFSSTVITLTSNNAVTFSNMKQGRIYKIKVKQGPSPAGEIYTPTFSGMKWPNGTPFTPTVGTGKIDFIEVWYDGVNYYGDFIKNYA